MSEFTYTAIWGFLVSCMMLIMVIGFSGCGLDKPEDATLAYPSLILGNWTLQTAYRNERETGVLDGTFFRFLSEEHVSTNLPLSGRPGVGAMSAAYKLIADSMYLYPNQLPVVPFYIQHLDSHQLIMTAVLVNQDFRFDLIREDDGGSTPGYEEADD